MKCCEKYYIQYTNGMVASIAINTCIQISLFLVCCILQVSDCHSKSIQQQNVSVDETQDERIFALESTIKKLETIVQNVTKSKDKSEQPVMFYAKIANRDFTLHILSTVVFETVILNIGGCYDKYDGIFVAPRKGVYMFSWTVSTQSSKHAVTELVVEDKIISTTGNTDNAGGIHSASMTALCNMDKNEHAFIRTANHASANDFYSKPAYPQTSFLGMLVYDKK